VAALFHLELEHLISREVPCGVIFLGAAGTDVSSPHNFLEILLGYRLEYDSKDAVYLSPSYECFFIGSGATTEHAPGLNPPDMSPTSCAPYLKEKVALL
jgi:hypothetical protein